MLDKKLIILGLCSLIVLTGCSTSSDTETVEPDVQTSQQEQEELKEISQEELEVADGKDGNDCYVAIDGEVYEIKNSSLWVDGEHTTSSGQSKCGEDNTEALEKAPHGAFKLDSPKVTKIGTLAN